ncbi:MAG: DUF3795 domain-containing protein [Halanaerobiaceae bacterium]|jgi:hypothetical protein|nr:DUF3795 domain-containing protein [Halanaerobiaceae bacterium]
MRMLDAYCGLYCGACPKFMMTENGEIEEFAAKNGLSVEDFACSGCKSGQVAKWCRVCKLKMCAQEKGFDSCAECRDYPCTDLISFRDDPKYPYHKEIAAYLEEIKEAGKEAWLLSMKERWSCKNCGEPYNWYQLVCDNCKEKVNGYEEP